MFRPFCSQRVWGWVFWIASDNYRVDTPGHGWQIAGFDMGTMVENDDVLLALRFH